LSLPGVIRRTHTSRIPRVDQETVTLVKSQYRFYVPADSRFAEHVLFPAAIARQIRTILRLTPGGRVVAFDGSGSESLIELTEVGTEVRGRIVAESTPDVEANVRVALFHACLKGKHVETVWQKCTELGAASLTAVTCERSVADIPNLSHRERLAEIVREATEQSGRTRLPELGPGVTFTQAVDADADVKLIFAAGTDTPSRRIDEALAESFTSVAVLIGPEGGFSPREVELAQSRGWSSVSMGPRTLRAETAAIVAVALVLHESRTPVAQPCGRPPSKPSNAPW
jgi:16S rRNA (uracil1498-N3)-methyltransferase